MRSRIFTLNKTGRALVPACIAGIALYIRVITGIALPLYPSAALLLASLVLSIRLRRRRRMLLFAVIALLGAGTWSSWMAHSGGDSLENAWRESESRTIGATLVAAGTKVHALEMLSADIGTAASEFVLLERSRAGEDSLAFRLKAFGEFERLANEAGKSEALPAGMEIGIQLFDARGARIAWAGWPQTLFPVDERFVTSGEHVVYSRQVSLYRVLTDCIPVRRGDEEQAAATIIVEIPLEANYKVNNKFIKGASLADDIGRGPEGAVAFDYYPASESAQLHRRQIKHPASPARADSTASGERYPSYMERIGDIGGDKTAGLNGRAVVRNALGYPILDVSVHGYPFRHFLERRQAPFALAAKLCVLAALLVLFIAGFASVPARAAPAPTALKVNLLVVFMAVFRYSLLSFQTVTPGGGLKIFDPVIFATPALWGLMRSAGDLLITALAFVVALYGVLKITRSGNAGPRSASGSALPGMFLLKGAAGALILLAFFELSRRFINMVVVNANPRLIGQAVDFFESQVIVLHLGVFLMMVGISLSAIVLMWGVFRLKGRGDAGKTAAVAAVAVAASALLWGWVFGILSLLVLAFVVFAPRFIHREDLVSIVIAAFYLVAIISGTAYIYLSSEYQGLRKTFVQERAAELANPADNWKAFIIEDILEELSKDPALVRALRQPGSADIRNLGFNLWAESPLSLLGYSSALYVFDRGDSVVSRFTVDMPFRADFSEGEERTDTPSGQSRAVLKLAKATTRGVVRFYRGIVTIGEFIPEPGDRVQQFMLGKVIIDVPYFFENLSWAALTGPRTPEILRNVQEGGIEPRIEEPEALVLARLKGAFV
ncbi:MAG: hypothetical protein HY770_03800, partial [Chitinivibrionia bacterium]|nr:hypothetical protein [Chitinivibrionia bacterium]